MVVYKYVRYSNIPILPVIVKPVGGKTLGFTPDVVGQRTDMRGPTKAGLGLRNPLSHCIIIHL